MRYDRPVVVSELARLTQDITAFNATRPRDGRVGPGPASLHNARVRRRNELRALLATPEDDEEIDA